MSLLSVENLTMRFGGLTAVENLSLSVEPGQIFSVIGPNGAGKTTVFNAITGIYPASEGEILVSNRNPQAAWGSRVVFCCLAIGVLTGFLFTLALQIQSLWESVITANYVYQQPFPWRKALGESFSFFATQPLWQNLTPFLAAGCLGLLASLVVWNRSRITPDRISRAGVARTFQNIRLFPQLTVLENVLLGMDAHLRTGVLDAVFRLPRFYQEQRSSQARAREILTFVELLPQIDSLASALCYGHRRRLEIARALASKPKVLLLDEPAAGLNPAESKDLVELIRRIRESGVSVLLIEHHMPLVMDISDRIAVLHYGRKIAEGTPTEVRHDPAVCEAYLGTSS